MKTSGPETLPGPRGLGRRLTGALLLVVTLGVAAFGLSRVDVDTGISSFVPRGDDSYQHLLDRDEDFGGEPVVVLLSGSTRDGIFLDPEQLPRLVGLEGELARLPDVAVVYGPGTVLNQTAVALRDVVLQISGARDSIQNTSRAKGSSKGLRGEALNAYVDKHLASFDRRYGALIAEAMPMGLPSLSNRKFVASVLFDDEGEPRSEWRFLAPTAKSATLLVRPRAGLDQAGTEKLVERVRETVAAAGLATEAPVITGVPVLTSALSSAATDEAPKLGIIAVAAVALVLMVVPWTRRRRDRLRPLVAVVLGTASTLALFGLIGQSMSLGVVAFLPIVLGIGSDFPIYLARRTRPRVVLAAAAGATLGFGSLMLSPLPFVREFGLALALGLLCTLGWSFVLRGWLSGGVTGTPGDAKRPRRSAWQRVPRVVAAAVVGVAVLTAGLGWVALPSLDVESRTDRLASGLDEVDDLHEAVDRLGFSGEVTIEIRGDQVLTPETLAWASSVETRLLTAHGDSLRPLLTLDRLLDFLGSEPTPAEISAGTSLLPSYLFDAVIADGGRVGAMTFGLRLDDVADQKALIDQIRSELPTPPDGLEADVVGLPVVAASGLDAVSVSRWTIGLIGMVVAALAVGVGLRSWRVGAMVAATALLAAGWVHLGLRLFGQDLTPLTLAVGALITVTACEFTVMLAERRDLGRAVTVAAMAATIGYLALTASQVALLSTFGWVLALGVSSSCLAAWLVTSLVAAWAGPHPLHADATAASAIEPEREVVSCP
ncbi:MMPL family transporter [Nocardioides daejeonensis]|uniref:MMPL family transporter n=1 Tax=Nocardioides daejeonensis TaxID=1046556 RepID=UPI000D74BC25|nr:MMPL family transporter [Nocardioides daejeonensis]